MLWKITSDYGTFSMWKIVEASDRETALEQCGIMQDMTAQGWRFDESPDGEEHTAELQPAIRTTPEQMYVLRNIKKIFDKNTGPDGWDICILEELEEYLNARGVEVMEAWETNVE